MRLVSITTIGETTVLRRYEAKDLRDRVCTHAGRYQEGVTPASVGWYRDYGAHQDAMPVRARRLTA